MTKVVVLKPFIPVHPYGNERCIISTDNTFRSLDKNEIRNTYRWIYLKTVLLFPALNR